jgi:uncharacterized membrane protein YczE
MALMVRSSLGVMPWDVLHQGLAGRAAFAAAGILLNGVATAAYIGVRLGPGPRDGLMTGLVRRTGGPLGPIRTAIEVTVVLTGWLLGGTLGVVTVLYALSIGPLVHLLLPRFALTPPEAVG